MYWAFVFGRMSKNRLWPPRVDKRSGVLTVAGGPLALSCYRSAEMSSLRPKHAGIGDSGLSFIANPEKQIYVAITVEDSWAGLTREGRSKKLLRVRLHISCMYIKSALLYLHWKRLVI